MDSSLGVGWVFALSRGSDWGSVEGLFADYLSGEDPVFSVKSPVWGRLRDKNFNPQAGDGFAFYHTTRALFPKGDRFRGRPRISLVGTLKVLERDGQSVTYIKVDVERRVFVALRERPIVRDECTEAFFRRCGILPGPPASFYQADNEAWAQLCKWVDGRMESRK